MLEFVVGGFYTLILLVIGFAGGWAVGARKLDDVVKDVRRQLVKPSDKSGPIKPMTKQEREFEGDKEAQKIAKMLEEL